MRSCIHKIQLLGWSSNKWVIVNIIVKLDICRRPKTRLNIHMLWNEGQQSIPQRYLAGSPFFIDWVVRLVSGYVRMSNLTIFFINTLTVSRASCVKMLLKSNSSCWSQSTGNEAQAWNPCQISLDHTNYLFDFPQISSLGSCYKADVQ